MDKRLVRTHFGRSSKTYDEYAVVQKKMGLRLAAMVANAGAFKRILEIGCGTGFLTKRLAELYPEAEIIASDISPQMLEQARENLGEYANIEYMVVDGEALTLAGPFDLIVSNAAFQWFKDYPAALEGLKEKLAPGGYLFYATFGEKTFWELHQAFAIAREKLGIGVDCDDRHGPTFITRETLERIVDALSMPALFQEELFVETFGSVKEFLLSVKRVGANNASGQQRGTNRRLLLKMMDAYQKLFAPKSKIEATYHVIYACQQNL
ncbi:MAG: malonyl-ACP O-methyltransferase BioC [Selenomonadaceae bacterium]